MKTVAADPLARQHLAGPGLHAFFNIAGKWELTTDEARCLLGAPGRATFSRWKRDRMGSVSADVLERISYILGLVALLSSQARVPRLLSNQPRLGHPRKGAQTSPVPGTQPICGRAASK